MFDGRWRTSFEAGLKPVGANLRRTGITADHLTASGVVLACAASIATGDGVIRAGVLLWVLGASLAAGEPGLYFRVQEAWHRSSSPFVGAWHFFMRPFDSTWRGEALEHPARFLDYVYFLLIAAIAVFQARRRRYSDAAWTAGALLLPVGTGISASLSRYVLVVYPFFYALAELFEYRPRLRIAWWIASAALLLAGEAAFVHWRWVA